MCQKRNKVISSNIKKVENIIQSMHADSEIWDIFTKREEYTPSCLDRYDRFPYYLSKYRNVMQPVVSQYLIEKGLQPEYPDGKRFAICLTHDIDVLTMGVKHHLLNSGMSVIKGNLRNGVQHFLYALDKKKHPYWNFRQIIELEEKYGGKSSFYFLALKPGERDFNYDLEEVASEIKYIRDSGWEVGLHGGHGSYLSLDDLVQKKKMLESVLGKEVVGFRNHFLRFRIPDTWELLSKAGFKYDTTFGYADTVGFRNGMCHPFKPFDLITGKEIDLIEIPLVIMDCTLLGDYMRLDHERAWEITRQLIDTVEQCRGVITILWHNAYMQDDNLRFYERLLEYGYEKKAWMTSAENIFWWYDHSA